MYLTEVEKLARFLMNPGLTVPEVCRFLVLETLVSLKPTSLYAAAITHEGNIVHVGSFGIPQELIKAWGISPLTIDVPLVKAVKSDEIIVVSKNQMVEKFPGMDQFDVLNTQWEVLLACPVLPFGLFSLTLDVVPKVDHEMELFLRAVGLILAANIERSDLPLIAAENKVKLRTRLEPKVLTERQMVIKALMEKGFTNPAIAAEIGYSESLVRQETMTIYSLLDISGRKELLARKPN
jgi:DNA-binding CsgD family transcriptional regulator